jgi:hypothetical protein
MVGKCEQVRDAITDKALTLPMFTPTVMSHPAPCHLQNSLLVRAGSPLTNLAHDGLQEDS